VSEKSLLKLVRHNRCQRTGSPGGPRSNYRSAAQFASKSQSTL